MGTYRARSVPLSFWRIAERRSSERSRRIVSGGNDGGNIVLGIWSRVQIPKSTAVLEEMNLSRKNVCFAPLDFNFLKKREWGQMTLRSFGEKPRVHIGHQCTYIQYEFKPN